MPSNMLGLLELLLVLGLALVWALVELAGLRRDKKRKSKAPPQKSGPRR